MTNVRLLLTVPAVLGIGLASSSTAQAASAEPLQVASIIKADNWVDHAIVPPTVGIHRDADAELILRFANAKAGLADLGPLQEASIVVIDVLRIMSQP
jgi:hypothetical protein